MKKCIFIIMIITMMLSMCEKHNDVLIQIKTDKVSYSIGEKIAMELINESDSTARFYVCSSYRGIPPNIYKFEDNAWNGYWGPICNGYSSFCCGNFDAGAIVKDTLDIDLEKGIYRIEYQFILRPSYTYESYFSNSIEVK